MGFFASALRLARNPKNSKRFRIKFRTLVGHEGISLYAAIATNVYKIEKTSPPHLCFGFLYIPGAPPTKPPRVEITRGPKESKENK
jgi:hypothetical protein